MNEYEVTFVAPGECGGTNDTVLTILGTSLRDAERVAGGIRQEHWGEIESVIMIHRGIVPHDLSSGTSES